MAKKAEIKAFWNQHLDGTVLFTGIVISLVIAVLLTAFISMARLVSSSILNGQKQLQCYTNLQSGANIASSVFFTKNFNNKWMTFENSADSIMVSRSQWGAYLLEVVASRNQHFYATETGIYGCTMEIDTALTVSNQNATMGLAGRVIFEGRACLPGARFESSKAEGQPYENVPSNNSFVCAAPHSIRKVSDTFRTGVISCLHRALSITSDMVRGRVVQPFNRETLVYAASEIAGVDYTGNIILVGNNVVVDSSCRFKSVLIVGSSVRFKSGFKGTVHVIASDSIVSEEKCVFKYPSSFVLYGSGNREHPAQVELGAHCKFAGGIVAFTDSDDDGVDPVLAKLAATDTLIGILHSDGYAELHGVIYGSVTADKLVIKNGGGVYDNVLSNCQITSNRYPFLGVPAIHDINGRQVCCINGH